MTSIAVESSLTFVYETLIDLASNADRQAARAAQLDDTRASSALFVLADELRVMATVVKEADPVPAAFDLLDAGRVQVATAALRFDAAERGAADEA